LLTTSAILDHKDENLLVHSDLIMQERFTAFHVSVRKRFTMTLSLKDRRVKDETNENEIVDRSCICIASYSCQRAGAG
jgi:hypothetical protein